MPADSSGRSDEVRDEVRTVIETRRELVLTTSLRSSTRSRSGSKPDSSLAWMSWSPSGPSPRTPGSEQLWLALGSLIAAIPLSGIASGTGTVALAAVWTMIAIINVALAISRQGR